MTKPAKYKLDKEETEILEMFETQQNIQSSNTLKQDMINAKTATANYLKKSERINIRLNSYDLNHIKQIAVREGIPYQTLISSVLHKFAAGHTTAKRKAG